MLDDEVSFLEQFGHRVVNAVAAPPVDPQALRNLVTPVRDTTTATEVQVSAGVP